MSNCPNWPIGCTPLNDLLGSSYQGKDGGLYGDVWGNEPPYEHRLAGELLAQLVTPLDVSGKRNGNGAGLIGFIGLGPSGMTHLFEAVQSRIASPPNGERVNPRLVTVECGIHNKHLEEFAVATDDCWQTVLQRVGAAGLDPRQVQVAWIMEGASTQFSDFSDGVKIQAEMWVSLLNNLRSYFPNLRIAFVTSHFYAGYSDTQGLEPGAYEGAFGLRRAIFRQIGGDPDLARHHAPWICWAGYSWTDGATPRLDGLTSICPDDFTADGQHPSAAGAGKFTADLWTFLTTSNLATPWFLTQPQAQ